LAGSFGQVFKSKLKSSGKRVAIKHVVGDNTAIREAAIFAMLAAHAHPNIIKLHGVRCRASRAAASVSKVAISRWCTPRKARVVALCCRRMTSSWSSCLSLCKRFLLLVKCCFRCISSPTSYPSPSSHARRMYTQAHAHHSSCWRGIQSSTFTSPAPPDIHA
jgi:hypothetical protein